MQMLDLKSICALAKCNRSLKKDAGSRFALATQGPFRVETLTLRPERASHQIGLLQYHPDIHIVGSWNSLDRIPAVLIHITAHLDIDMPLFDAPEFEETFISAKRLQYLTISYGDIRNKMMVRLFRMLRKRETMNGISGLRTMTIISKIFGEDDTIEELVSYIVNASQLVKLSLVGCTFEKEALHILANGIVKSGRIKTLNLDDSNLGHDAELALSKILHSCPSLTSLSLSEARFRGKNKYHRFEAIASAVMDMDCNLQSLNVSDFYITSNALVPMISKLHTLDVSNNRILDIGIRAIGDALKISKTITDINLGNNLWTAVGMEDILVFLSNLAANKSLQRLGLYGCDIGEAEFLIHLKAALVGKAELRKLDLGDNSIDDDGCQHVAEILTKCPYLEILDLNVNSIGSIGMRTIAAALPHAKNLQQLDLDWNIRVGVDDASSAVLFAAIHDHPSLAKVIIYKSEYGFNIEELAMQVLERLTPDRIEIRSY
jgi:Ran GTPase-activating protein (RanGAP) involved in mRNA processing and transport